MEEIVVGADMLGALGGAMMNTVDLKLRWLGLLLVTF
jgi:hypothetical protein